MAIFKQASKRYCSGVLYDVSIFYMPRYAWNRLDKYPEKSIRLYRLSELINESIIRGTAVKIVLYVQIGTNNTF